MSQECPSDLALEAYLRQPNTAPAATHVGVCVSCATRVAQMKRDGERFEAFVFPATVDEVVRRARLPQRRPRLNWRWLVPVFAVPAAAAAVVVVVDPFGPPANYDGIKGEIFSVFVNKPTGAEAVRDGAEVPATGALRFEVHPPHSCHLAILSVDGTGQVSKLFPPHEDSARIERSEALPGGAVLDGQKGPERFFALCSPAEIAFSKIERAIKSSIPPSETSVRAAQRIHGLPDDVVQDTVLLEKRP